MKDYMIVGCGIYGATFARIAADKGRKVLIIDKRNHIAGNCYTEYQDGIYIHKYGPHIFHTNSDIVWDFVNRFTDFNSFVNRPLARVGTSNDDCRIYSLPINLHTLSKVYNDVATPEEAREKIESERVKIDNPQNLEEFILSQIGEKLYKLFIYGYTKKQWNREPKDLPATIIKRIPIRFNFDNNYYNAKYQGIPLKGYTHMVGNMIDHPNIEVKTGEVYDGVWESIARKLIYTGSPDSLFNYEWGPLEYRSLRFNEERLDVDDFQGNAVVNYTNEKVPFTRITEHKHFTSAKTNHTIITKEYPEDWDKTKEAYYPVANEENNKKAGFYNLKAMENKIFLAGRLGSYKYLDMDQVIGMAINNSKNLL